MKKILYILSIAGLLAVTAQAAYVIEPTEFLGSSSGHNAVDQDGFQVMPGYLNDAVTWSNAFANVGLTTSQTTTVTVTSSSTIGQATKRWDEYGGTPPPSGFTYTNLYTDVLIAKSPTGQLTLDFAGLNASTEYTLTLFAYDPGAYTTSDERTWTVTAGTGSPVSNTLIWSDPLLDNNTFAMVFDITTTASGTFQLQDTGTLTGSGINGFILEVAGDGPGSDTEITGWTFNPEGVSSLTFTGTTPSTYSVQSVDQLTGTFSNISPSDVTSGGTFAGDVITVTNFPVTVEFSATNNVEFFQITTTP